jgi:hypothetical protein
MSYFQQSYRCKHGSNGLCAACTEEDRFIGPPQQNVDIYVEPRKDCEGNEIGGWSMWGYRDGSYVLGTSCEPDEWELMERLAEGYAADQRGLGRKATIYWSGKP